MGTSAMEMVLQNALPGALPHEVGSEKVLGFLWSLIVRAVRRDVLSQEESLLLEQVRTGAESYGAPILQATSRQNLKDRIAEAVESSGFNAYWRDLMTTVVSKGDRLLKSSVALQSDTESRQLLQSVLSGGALPYVEQGLKYMDASVRLMPLLMERLRAVGTDPSAVFSESVMDLIDNQDVPVEVAEALYEGQCALVVTFAINAAMLRHQKLEPWLGLGLAERWSRGLKSSLRLLAADEVIGAELPESVLSREERLDVNAVTARHAQAVAAFRALNSAAERAGAAIYPAGV